MMYHSDDPYVYDQKCSNCRWWGVDWLTDKEGCQLPQKVKKGRKTGNTWCWKWERRKPCR